MNFNRSIILRYSSFFKNISRFNSSLDLHKPQRIICYPIKGNNWLYFRIPDNKKIIKQENHHSNEILLFSSILGRKNTKKFTESRMHYYYCKLKQSALRMWDYIEKAEPHTLRKTVLYPPAQAIFYRSFTPSERFFTSIELSSIYFEASHRSIEIIYPSFVSQSDIKDNLVKYCRDSYNYHLYWKQVNMYLLPLSIISWLIPGLLNIPAYWNVYRYYCQWSTSLTADYILNLLLDNPQKRNKDLSPIHITFKSNDTLSDIVSDIIHDNKQISEDNIEDIVEKFNIPEEYEKIIAREVSFELNPPKWKITMKDLSEYFSKIKNRHQYKE